MSDETIFCISHLSFCSILLQKPSDRRRQSLKTWEKHALSWSQLNASSTIYVWHPKGSVTPALTLCPPLTDRKWPPAAAHGPWSPSAPSAGIARTAGPDLSAHKPELCLTGPSGTAPLPPRRLSAQRRRNIHLNTSLSALLHRYVTESRVRADACEAAFVIQHYNLEAIIRGLPCSWCRCRAQSASCTARRPLLFSVVPAPWPAAPSACTARSWPPQGWLYVCTKSSCLWHPGTQKNMGNTHIVSQKRVQEHGLWQNSSIGSTSAAVWKGLAGHNETMKRWKIAVYSKLYSEVRPKLSTDQDKQDLMGHFPPNYPEEERAVGGGAEPVLRYVHYPKAPSSGNI